MLRVGFHEYHIHDFPLIQAVKDIFYYLNFHLCHEVNILFVTQSIL